MGQDVSGCYRCKQALGTCLGQNFAPPGHHVQAHITCKSGFWMFKVDKYAARKQYEVYGIV